MMNLETAIKRALDDHGATAPGWKIEITGIEHAGSSDWATVLVNVIRPRCRKPCGIWELSIWLPGMLLRWDKSKYTRL